MHKMSITHSKHSKDIRVRTTNKVINHMHGKKFITISIGMSNTSLFTVQQ
jgi:hypothetical protein